MIPRECKRLAEVDFPIAEVSRWALEDKRVRDGHPSSLHIWWARRPLASCRAILLALLLPDPLDPHCPERFKVEARSILAKCLGTIGTDDEELRKKLLQFIAAIGAWRLIDQRDWIDASRELVRAAYPEETPLVVDPFAGGGSIPLEALRIGADGYASDLNPVASLILKITLDRKADELEKLIAEFAEAAEQVVGKVTEALRKYYPRQDGEETVGYLWARTVRCEAPDCGAEFPLLKSFWLSSTRGSQAALRYRAVRRTGTIATLEIEVFEPRNAEEVPAATVSRARARCPCCDVTLPPDRVRAQLAACHGGTDVIFDAQGRRTGGARLMAVAVERKASPRRRFRNPTNADYAAIHLAQRNLQAISAAVPPGSLNPVPDEPLTRVPVSFGVINVWVYGMQRWGDLFSARHALTLTAIAQAIRSLSDLGYGIETQTLLGFALSIFARTCNGNARLRPDGSAAPAFGMQALPFTWAFPEPVPWGRRAETFAGATGTILSVLRGPALRVSRRGQSDVGDARKVPLPDESAAIWFTDPPYYDAIPYSYLSDFFYVWLKRAIGHLHPRIFDQQLTPKVDEIVSYRIPGSNESPTQRFERMMGEAFSEGRRILDGNGIASIVFAHKTTEGWEALLSGIVGSGWTITASWPIATEAANRLRARNAAALATSVHLVCRPRPENTGVGDWADVLRELPDRVGEWMSRLEQEGVRGADLVFACIGPALEIFSRYSRVETAEGGEIPLAQYLEKVWEVVGRTALAQVLGNAEAQASDGSAGALEEDARLTALFLWTHRSTAGNGIDANGAAEAEEEPDEEDDEENGGTRKAAKGFTLIFDIVRRFAQPLGIHLDAWEGRIVETKKGVVRLLPVGKRARQLFGAAGVAGLADRIERVPAAAGQLELFPELHEAEETRPRGRRGRFAAAAAQPAVGQATTLDRVHTAMLLQASGRTNGLRNLLAAEQQRGPDSFRLSQSLPALPTGTRGAAAFGSDAPGGAAMRIGGPRHESHL